MNYKEFLSAVESEMTRKLGCTRQVQIQKVTKNNSIIYDSLLIVDPLVNISPTIYLNPYYHRYLDGVSMPDIIADIYNTYQAYMPQQNVNTEIFTDYENMRENIIMKLVNYEQNQEMLSDVPHVRYLDFAVIFQCLVKNLVSSTGTITIHSSHMEALGVSTDTLYRDAIRNTPKLLPFYFRNICDCMSELISRPDYEFPVPAPESSLCSMYVLSNQNKVNGAASILYPGLLKAIADRLGTDLFLLPSSVHEFLIVPSDTKDCRSDLQYFSFLVQEVNESELTDEDYLSDQAYFYERNTGIVYESKKLNPA